MAPAILEAQTYVYCFVNAVAKKVQVAVLSVVDCNTFFSYQSKIYFFFFYPLNNVCLVPQ